jgi:hypothetical protein
LDVRIVRRKQKRKPQRICEATAKDWARWDKAAQAEGVAFAEFTRRALEQRYREFVK